MKKEKGKSSFGKEENSTKYIIKIRIYMFRFKTNTRNVKIC